MTNAEIEDEIKALRTRITQLRALIRLRKRVADLELRAWSATCDGELGAIVTAVAGVFGLPSGALLSRTRREPVATARLLVCKIARDRLRMPYTRLAAALGLRDHSAVVHAVRTASARLETEPSLKRVYDDVVGKIDGAVCCAQRNIRGDQEDVARGQVACA